MTATCTTDDVAQQSTYCTPPPPRVVSSRLTIFPETRSRLHPQVYFSVMRVPKSFRTVEVETVFSALRQDWARMLDLFAVLTVQPTGDMWGCVDCTQTSSEASAFKDDSSEHFLRFVRSFQRVLMTGTNSNNSAADEQSVVIPPNVERLTTSLWLNGSDPATGLPLFTEFGERSFTTYDEGSGMEVLAAYGKTLINTPLGPCHVCSHPSFGSNFYPATFFVACHDAAELLRAASLL